MSKPRELWYDYVRRVIRHYPEYKRERDSIQSMAVTPSYAANGGGSGPGRMAERAALRELEPEKERYYTAVHDALEHTARIAKGRREARVRFVTLYHFKPSHTMEGAAAACFVSYATARRWNQEFMREVTRNLGLADD